MLRKDYLEKQLEQLGRTVSELISRFLSSGSTVPAATALEKTEKMLREEFGLSLAGLQSMGGVQLSGFLSEKGFAPGKTGILADLLFATAEFAESKGEAAVAAGLYSKARILYEYVNQTEKTWSEVRQQRIGIVKNKNL